MSEYDSMSDKPISEITRGGVVAGIDALLELRVGDGNVRLPEELARQVGIEEILITKDTKNGIIDVTLSKIQMNTDASKQAFYDGEFWRFDQSGRSYKAGITMPHDELLSDRQKMIDDLEKQIEEENASLGLGSEGDLSPEILAVLDRGRDFDDYSALAARTDDKETKKLLRQKAILVKAAFADIVAAETPIPIPSEFQRYSELMKQRFDQEVQMTDYIVTKAKELMNNMFNLFDRLDDPTKSEPISEQDGQKLIYVLGELNRGAGALVQ
jgi:hypothetical protein